MSEVRVPSLKKQRQERTEQLMAEPSTLSAICDDLAEGGTLAEFCRSRDVKFGLILAWVKTDADRVKAYTDAIEAQRSNLSDRVVAGLRRIAEADPRRAVDARGQPLPVHKLPEDVALAMAGHDVTVDDHGRVTTKLRLTPRNLGYDGLGRHLGLFKPDTVVNVNVGFADKLNKARERASQRK